MAKVETKKNSQNKKCGHKKGSKGNYVIPATSAETCPLL